jgi:hypothetical protein
VTVRALGTSIVVAATVLAFSVPARADVQLSIQNGRVTLLAKDATLRQILTEWARVGQTKVVNVERVPGGPMTLDMRDVPEQQALKQLLRSISGYLAAPRVSAVPGGSVFDRIIVMPTTVSAAPAASAGLSSQPTFAPPPPMAMPQVADDDNDDGPIRSPQMQPGNRGPVFVFPQPQAPQGFPQPQMPQQQPFIPGQGAPIQTGVPIAVPNPSAAYPGAPTTSAPVGVSFPGMVVPTPQPQPGQVVQPFPGRAPNQ